MAKLSSGSSKDGQICLPQEETYNKDVNASVAIHNPGRKTMSCRSKKVLYIQYSTKVLQHLKKKIYTSYENYIFVWYVAKNIHLSGAYRNKKNLKSVVLLISNHCIKCRGGGLEKICPKSQWSVYLPPNCMHYRALIFRQRPLLTTDHWSNKYGVLFDLYLCICWFWALFVIHPGCIVFAIKK